MSLTDNTGGDESSIGSVSVRAILATIIVLTVCGLSCLQIEVKEPLYTLAAISVGWYFGQKVNKP